MKRHLRFGLCLFLMLIACLLSSCQGKNNETIQVGLNGKNLDKTIIEYLSTVYGAKNLNRITSLSLVRNGLKRIDDLSGLVSLRDLEIGANQIERIEGIGNLKNLRSLSLVQDGIRRIEGLEGLENLEELHLNHNRIERIEGLGSLHKLRKLDLSDNSIEVIEGLEGLDLLQDFRAGGNRIVDFRGLLALKGLTKSITLLSRHNAITPEAQAILERVRKNNPNAQLLIDKTDWGSGNEEEK